MPVPGYPGSVEFLDYENVQSLDGSSHSTFTLLCSFDDLADTRDLFLSAVDANDANLHCKDFKFKFFGNDPGTGMYVCTAEFIPSWRLNALTAGQPFKVRRQLSSMSFTLPSSGWKWASGVTVNNQISPLKTVSIEEITLFGTRTGTDLSTYGSYSDKVNSDSFLGKGAGYVIFRTASANPRQLPDGTMTDDIEIRLQSRAIPWNQFWNETTCAWEEIRDASNNPMFSSCSMSALLT